jgi:arginine decarboxylase
LRAAASAIGSHNAFALDRHPTKRDTLGSSKEGGDMQRALKKPRAVVRPAEWTPAESAELYGIRNWGAGYFDIDDGGDVTVSVPANGNRVTVRLMDMIAGMQQRGMQMPVLLRLDNLLEAQIALLNDTFNKAIQTLGYQSSYHGVFPIKVNQQCAVIEEIVRVGARYGHGLEAGSRPSC